MANPQVLNLNLLVDDEANEVVYFESDLDFVNILLSFLTLPMGTIIRELDEQLESDKQSKIGCMHTLFESVKMLDGYHMAKACKYMLLRPRRQNLADSIHFVHKIGDEPNQFYLCPSCTTKNNSEDCLVSLIPCRCRCGMMMDSVFGFVPNEPCNGFVYGIEKIFITNNLHLIPESLVDPHRLKRLQELKRINVSIGRKELLQLLNRALVSKTPMTDTLLAQKQEHMHSSFRTVLDECQTLVTLPYQVQQTNPYDPSKKMSLQLFVRKSNNKVLFAIASADFVNLLFSFLTLPLGSIIKLFLGRSSIGSVDHLYTSAALYYCQFMQQDFASLLLDPKVRFPWGIENQLLPVSEDKTEFSISIKSGDNRDLEVKGAIINPKFDGKVTTESGGSYARGLPSPPFNHYFVTDELSVLPKSNCGIFKSVDHDDIIYYFGVHTKDLRQENVTVGESEALLILKAAMTSKTVLTDVFCKSQ